MSNRDLTLSERGVIETCRFILLMNGLADRFDLVERVDPEQLPVDVVFIDHARAEREKRLPVRERVL